MTRKGRRSEGKASPAASAPAALPASTRGRDAFRAGAVVLVAIVLALLPLANFRALYSARVSQVLAGQTAFLALAALLLPLCLLVDRRTGGLTRQDLVVLAFTAVSVLTSVLGPAPGAFLVESLFAVAFGGLYFLVRWLRPRGWLLGILTAGVAVAALLVAGAGILQHHGIELLAYVQRERVGKLQITSLLGNPNYVASFLAPALLLLAGMGWATGRRLWRIVAAVCCLPVVWCLVLAGGRAAWMGMLAGMLVIGFLLLRIRHAERLGLRHLALGLAAPIVGALLLFGAMKIANPGFDPVQRLTSVREFHMRLFPWMVARDMFLEHPILGIGTGRFFARYDPATIEFFRASEERSLYEFVLRLAPGDRPDHLHNEYFQILIDSGLVGLGLFALVLAAAGLGAWHVVRSTDRPAHDRLLAVFLAGALVAALVDAFWGFPFRLPCSGALFWLILALLGNLAEDAGDQPPVLPLSRAWTPRIVVALLLAAVLGTATWGSVQKIHAMKTRIHYWRSPQLLRGSLDNVRELFRAHTLGSASHPPPFEIVDFYLRREAWRFAHEHMLALANVYSLGSSGYLQLGVIEYQLGNDAQAREAFAQALVLEPDAPHILEFLAHAELKLGEVDSAREHLLRAAELDPARPNAHFLLGAIREAAGDASAAADYYRRAVRCAVQAPNDLWFNPTDLRVRIRELEAAARNAR
ncbi:MAG: O-antigen ligase family protein [Candidatus Sumerlaeia bacterium]|nr:O-antigen ligase family protein [Candidatus Sumerlaeia bacterium]